MLTLILTFRPIKTKPFKLASFKAIFICLSSISPSLLSSFWTLFSQITVIRALFCLITRLFVLSLISMTIILLTFMFFTFTTLFIIIVISSFIKSVSQKSSFKPIISVPSCFMSSESFMT